MIAHSPFGGALCGSDEDARTSTGEPSQPHLSHTGRSYSLPGLLEFVPRSGDRR